MPGDVVFIFLGALPIFIAATLGYLESWSRPGSAAAPQPAAAGN
jgi:hypothetical protein